MSTEHVTAKASHDTHAGLSAKGLKAGSVGLIGAVVIAGRKGRFGVAEETLEFAGTTAADLVAQLQARGGAWAGELAAGRAFRVAVDQSIVALDAPLVDGVEVAIFPPVTGG